MNPKRIISLLLIFVLLLSFPFLSGCADNSSQTTAPPQSQHTYVGSINSDKYHKPSCRCAGNILLENEIWFSSKEEAEEAGYIPCQVCRP
jgi:hypothetical protein